MIQPNEKLLPGNVVMYHGNKDVHQILDALKIYNISYSDSYYPLVYSPIPLTPEILVQWCGFDRLIDRYWKNYPGGAIIILLIGENENEFKLKFGAEQFVNITHLHTLQNTVYFLSGEEMPVNIPNN